MITELRMKTVSTLAIVAMATLAITALSANADLVGQYGILDLTANDGINPNTGVEWQLDDQYRLAFYTDGKIDGQSDDPAVYDAFATTQAQMNPALATSTGWTAMVWVNTDAALPQAVDLKNIQAGESPLSSPRIRGGYDDTTDGAGIGGAGVPVYAMNGTTCIARNNADILNNWSNPFDGDTTLRLASGTTNLNSDGEEVVASQNVNYSPFLNQYGLGDTANVHGTNCWTGGLANPVNPLGNSVDPDGQTRGSWGSSNANTAGRVWNRFNSGTTSSLSVYVISDLLTIVEASTSLLGDLNHDDVVDAADYIILKQNFGTASGAALETGDIALADGTPGQDGAVDINDLNLLAAQFAPASQAVPEPATACLLALGTLALIRRRRS